MKQKHTKRILAIAALSAIGLLAYQPPIQAQKTNQPATSQASEDEPSMLVKSLSFRGIEGIATSQELEKQLPELAGTEATLPQLKDAAAQITRYLRQQGYIVATAYIPPQDFSTGHVDIAVAVGHYDEVKLANHTDIPDAVILRELGTKVKSGEIIQQQNLERGILLVNDLADVEASSLLMAGSQSGTSSLLITVNPKNHPVSGYLGVDNGGYSNTGRYRYSALVNGANPLKQGDIFTASVLYTGHGQTGYSFTYGSPAFGQGQRYGISYGRSQYEIGGAFTGMGMQGDADTLSLSYQLNILRSRMANNYVGLRYDYKWLQDNYDSFNWQGRKTSGAVVLETHGDWQDRSHLGLAQNNYSLSYTYGHMSHEDDITKAMAGFGAMVPAGNFGKWNLSYTRNQPLAGRLSLYTALNMQWSANSLDSSEKMPITGPFAVRAYPTGEASGDRAWLATAELRWTLPQPAQAPNSFQLVAFVDGGGVENILATSVTRELYGWGVGLNWNNSDNWMARLHYARKFNMEKDTADVDRSGRLWFQLYKFF